MAGAVKDVQGRINTINEKAIYVHCAAHCLNLAILKACQLPSVRKMMRILKEVCLFFNSNPKRRRCLEETIVNEAQLQNRWNCKTRSVERHQAFETFSEMYEVILLA